LFIRKILGDLKKEQKKTENREVIQVDANFGSQKFYPEFSLFRIFLEPELFRVMFSFYLFPLSLSVKKKLKLSFWILRNS